MSLGRLLLVVLLSSAALSVARAQANSATATQTLHLQVFGVGSYMRPEFGGYVGGAGFSAGGNIGATVPHLHNIEPSLEVRYTYGHTPTETETVLGGGARVAYHAGRLHPYGDFLVGKGNLAIRDPASVAIGYTHNDSKVYMYGGGLDYDVSPTFALRADVQRQSWKLDAQTPTFYPVHFSLGLRYQFRFHNRYGME